MLIEEMVQAGGLMLQDLQKKEAALDEQIESISIERVELHQARAKRQELISDARARLTRATLEDDTMRGYATLSQGLANEKAAIKNNASTKKAVQAARHDLELIAREVDTQDRASLEQEQALEARVMAFRTEREARQDEIRAVLAGYDKAHSELGNARYLELSEEYKKLQSDVSRVSELRVAAQVTALEYYTDALAKLNDWPSLQRDFRRLEPVHDSTSRLLAATIAYMEALLACQEVQAIPGVYATWQFLSIPEQLLRDHPGQLREKMETMRDALARYSSQ